jgi:EmrB/QacA subfamily drug resistance transporter
MRSRGGRGPAPGVADPEIAFMTDEVSVPGPSIREDGNQALRPGRNEMTSARSDGRARWFALGVLCLGSLMIVLDSTIVNVALPSIKKDLRFSETSLAWVVNGYLLTFGGFLLLGGRLGDLFGHRRLFLAGIALFTLASLACGSATSQGTLVAARLIQGFGGAVVSAVSLSLMVSLFHEPDDRAKAMGVFGFVAAGGGTLGVLLGGILTDLLSWHWIFLVNIPIGIGVAALAIRVLPGERPAGAGQRLDVAGAVTVTAALMLAVYAIVNGNQAGWTSGQTLGLLAGAGAQLAGFLIMESRVESPLVPLSLFRLRNLATANAVGVLWAGAMFAWFFLSALYLQLVLGYSPLQVGLAFLPANLIMGAFSLGISAKLVMRFGIKLPLSAGLSLAAAGLILFARAPVGGHFWVDVLPSMILLGFGAGIAFNPVLLAAMGDVEPSDSGLASGLVNTSFMMGGALGLAVLASIAASRTSHLLASGHTRAAALDAGYHTAFLIGALFAIVAAALGALLLRSNAAVPASQRNAALRSDPALAQQDSGR